MYAIDHLNVLCISTPNTYESKRDEESSNTSGALKVTSFEAKLLLEAHVKITDHYPPGKEAFTVGVVGD